LDTGIDAAHPAMGTIANAAVHLTTGSAQSDFNDNTGSTDDIFGHGTHVAGIVASNDSTYKGVAYGTSLMNAKCGYRTTTAGAALFYYSDVYSAGDWAATNGAAVMNVSFGGYANPNNGTHSQSEF